MRKQLLTALFLTILSIGMKAQTDIANYTLAKSIGSYVALSTPTVLGTATGASLGASLDDINYRVAFPSGFTFSYGSVAQTSVNINTNGFVGFSTAIWTSSGGYTPLSGTPTGGTTTGIISAFGRDLNSYFVTGTLGEIAWELVGAAPNREFVIQYKNFKPYATSTTVGPNANFQIRLFESTHTTSPNRVAISYGNCVISTATATDLQVGIRGNSTTWNTNVNSLLIGNIPAGTSCNWSDAVTSNSNANSMIFTSTNTLVSIPNGLMYTWTPPVNATLAPVRVFSAVTNITLTSAAVAWTAPTAATAYNVQYRIPGTCAWTNFTGNPVAVPTATLTGLASSTVYQIRVQSTDGTNTAIWSHIPNTAGTGDGYTTTGTFRTLDPACVTPTAQPTALTFGGVTDAVVNGTYTPVASTVTTSYLVIRTLGTAPNTPTNGVTYTTGASAALGGTVVAVGTNSIFATTGLAGNTNYSYYVYSYTSVNCSGGPLYYTTSPLTGTVTTCPAKATAVTSGSITTGGFNLNWTASAGGSASPITYSVEVSTNSAFTGTVAGSPFLVTSPTTSLAVTGLTASTVYFYRITAHNGCNIGTTTAASLTTSAACPAPTTPTVTNISGFSAVATWTAGASETMWDVYYGPTPLTAPTATTVPTATVATTPSYTMSALTPTTGYAVYVRANCGAGGLSAWSAVRNFTTTVSCPAPTTLVISAVTPTTAVATWTNSGPATSWIFRYAPPTTTVSVSGTPSYTMTGLTPSTTYSAQVRGYCGVGDTSTWTTNVIFMTPCLPPNITATTPGSRCGIGTVTLGVTGDPGALFQWYTSAVAPVPVATGSVYTTPTLTNTTNFYVSASNVNTGSATYGAGALTGIGVAYNLTNGGYGGLKGQYLYTAAELRTAGLTAGNITSMSFEITSVGATLSGFAVEVGTTTLTAFPTPISILGGLTTVSPASTFVPVLGLNTITFATPYNWDGVSNIVISTSWSNNNASNLSSTVKYDNTTNFASQTYRKDNETAPNMFAFTGATGAGTFTYDRTQTRPVMRFAGNVLCESTRTMVAATVNTPPVLTVSSATAVCGNVISTVSVTSTLSDYNSYIWSPVTNLYTDAAATIPYAGGSASTLYYKSAVNGTTTYMLNASNSVSGCANVASTSRSTQVPAINASATPSVICSGAAVTLSATTNVIGSGTVAIGNGTSLTTATEELTAFCNRRINYRQQTLYTAAELTAGGLSAGNITSITYSISTLGDAPSNANFTVKCGTTALAAFTDYVSSASFTTVFPAASYTHAVGSNLITFSTPYVWDGVSNVVIEVSHDGIDNINNAQTYYSTLAANQTVYGFNNAASGTISTKRFNIILGGQTQVQGAGGLTWQWNPGAINSNTTTVMPVNTGTNPSTATYTITGTDPATTCSGNVAVTVTVNPVPTVPVTVNSIQCGVGTASASVSGGATYRWYATPTSTTVLQSGASTTYTTAISATTTFYVSSYNANCESARAAVTASVSIPDALTATSTSSAVCPGQSFTLTAVDTGTNNVYSYTWTATPAAGSGIATSVTGATTVVTPVTPGSYNYVLTGSDGVCTTTAAVTVMLSTPPQIIASASPSVACLGSTVTLNAMTGTIASGTVGIGVPTLTLSAFSDAGNPYNYWYGGQKEQYIFTAAELNAAGLTTGNITALSFDVVTSTALSMNNFSMTVGHTVQPASTFNLITTGLSTVYFNAAQPVTAGINNYVFSTPFNWNGTDNVVVSLSWSNVNSGNTALTPSVRAHNAGFNSTGYLYADNTAATAIAAATTSLSAGVGTTSQNNVTTNRPNIIFTGQRLTTGASGLTWQWNPGAVNSNTTTVVPSTPGTPSYTVTAIDPATTCSNTAVVTITVNPVPSVTVAASTGSICSGTTASLTATGATTYSWMPAGGTSSVAVVSPSATTVYTVTGTSLGCSNTQTVNLNVTATPTVIASASPSVICAGATVSLTASGATTYSWMPNSTSSGTTTATPTVSTTYTVSGTTAGCTDTKTLTVTVNNVPTLTLTTSPATGVLCTTGATATLTATGTSTAYAWNTGASTASISVAPSATTVYTVTGTNSCGVRTVTTTITVATTPTIAAAASSSIICAGNSAVLTTSATAGVIYSWNTGAGTTSISVSPSVTTTYTVTGTNACGSATATVVQNVSPCIGIEEMAGGEAISIYPNPASDYVNIAVPASLTSANTTVEVTDALGKLVMKEAINTDVTTLRISKLEDGIYFFKVITNNQTIKVGKVVKH